VKFLYNVDMCGVESERDLTAIE